MTIGERIFQARTLKGWPRKKVAQLTGVTDESLLNIEKGKTRSMTHEKLELVCKVLDIPLDEAVRLNNAGRSAGNGGDAPRFVVEGELAVRLKDQAEAENMPWEEYLSFALVEAAASVLRKQAEKARGEAAAGAEPPASDPPAPAVDSPAVEAPKPRGSRRRR